MMLHHWKMERTDTGETPVVWFINSRPYNDLSQDKAELSARSQEATGIPINPTLNIEPGGRKFSSRDGRLGIL